jgi:uncharacterized protein (TIGR02391 family)
MTLLERIREFQKYLYQSGLAQGVLALPAPSLLALPAPTPADIELDLVFDRVIEEPEILQVSRDLFDSGHYNIAVHEAFKAVDNFIQAKVSEHHLAGTQLMDQVFTPNAPKLVWSERKTRSQKDQQLGYHRLFSGAMLGIRNPTGHEFDWIDEPEEALECIVFAQHLLRKAKVAVASAKSS